MFLHSASYPRSAKSPRTRPNHAPGCPLGPARRFATFSTMRKRGRSSPTNRAISDQRPERLPASPSPFPATLRSWQGKPPEITSTGPTSSPRNVVTSSKQGTSGQCFASTRRQNGSISQNATVSNPPVRSSPRLKPPIPENRSKTFSALTPAPYASQGRLWSFARSVRTLAAAARASCL